jgi:hypothetical protein
MGATTVHKQGRGSTCAGPTQPARSSSARSSTRALRDPALISLPARPGDAGSAIRRDALRDDRGRPALTGDAAIVNDN